VVGGRIVALLEEDALIPSSQMTNLDDDTIMICFAADKGGTFMTTKIGLTVMNCMNPNIPDLFDLFRSLDTLDSYYNWKVILSK
jgi:hypothetical protein